ncbi:MAG: glycine cleavage system aminomethyltransferase GcvT [Elusimicrobiota bacterium]
MTTTETLRRTALYKIHGELGGRIVPFAGWELPVQYSSIIKEHQAVRRAAGLFDVSHMGQVTVEGPGALDFLQKVNANDISRLAPGQGMYSHMLNPKGGIVDDVIVSRLGPERFFIVVNAGTTAKDVAWLRGQAAGYQVTLEDKSHIYGMVALQGPKAADIIADMVPGAKGIKRFGALECTLYGQKSLVTRTGYTGEDGFEVIVPEVVVTRVWQTLMAQGASFGLLPCGLGCRDTLRLEAGLLLYGSDIDDDHTTLESGYGWVVKFSKPDFIGKAALEAQKRSGLKRRLTGVRLTERGVPRHGAAVFLEGKRLGELCSATFSPTFNTGIGMGYFDVIDLAPGRRVEVELQHGRRVAAEVAALPFYKSK